MVLRRSRPFNAPFCPSVVLSNLGALVDYFVSALRQNPELAIFLTIAVGFLIGGVKFGSFSLGIVVGCLLAGVLIGQLDIKVSPLVKTVFSIFSFSQRATRSDRSSSVASNRMRSLKWH